MAYVGIAKSWGDGSNNTSPGVRKACLGAIIVSVSRIMTNDVDTLQADISDHRIPVTTLLQRALALANKLGDKDFPLWAKRELNGYDQEDEDIKHRYLKGEYVVLTVDGRSLPIHWTSACDMNRRFITLPLPEVESLMGPDSDTFAVKIQIDPRTLTSLDLEPGDCVGFQVGRATVAGFLHAVRNRLLDWTFGLAARTTPGRVDHDIPVSDRRNMRISEENQGLGTPVANKGKIMADTSSLPADCQDAAHAKAWLESRVRPLLESLHSCYVTWGGNVAHNTNVEVPSITQLSPQDNACQLSLIQQYIIEVRGWALRKALPGLPPAPSAFSDREQAQSAFSEWCAYLEHLSDEPQPTVPTIGAAPKEHTMSNSTESRRKILQAIFEIQGDSIKYVNASDIAERVGLPVEDVEGYLEMLRNDGSIQFLRSDDGCSVFLMPAQKLAVKEGWISPREPVKETSVVGDRLPVEVTESLARFQADHPDPRKAAFVMMKYGATGAHTNIDKGIAQGLQSFGIKALRADKKEYHSDLFYNVLTYVVGCGFGIAVFERIEREDFNPNVSLEVGYMYGLGKQVCLLKDKTLTTLHTDIVGKLYRLFDPQDPFGTIPKVLANWVCEKGFDE